MTLLTYNPYRNVRNFNNRCYYDTPSLKMPEYLTPRIDMSESDQSIIIEAELPGITKKDVKLTIEDNILTIEGEKKNNRDDQDSIYYRNERIFRRFSRKFRLPETVSVKKINAEFENGILTIVLPKEEPKKPEERNISVK